MGYNVILRTKLEVSKFILEMPSLKISERMMLTHPIHFLRTYIPGNVLDTGCTTMKKADAVSAL